MDIQEPIANHKNYNIFTSTLVKNQIPSMIEMMKLETHHDLVLNNKVYQYVTNIILASQNWIKMYVMFDKNQVYEIYESEVYENIRTVHQIQKSLLIELDHRIICLNYQPGNLRTVGMLCLEFISLRPGYESFIRVDNNKKYLVMIAGDFLVFMLGAKCKQLSILSQMPIFQKASDQVKWQHHDSNYFHTIYFTKITKSFFKNIIDVQIDKGNVYLLVQQKQITSVLTLNFASLTSLDTPDTLFKTKLQNLPTPCFKITMLSYDTDSQLLLFSKNMIYHLSPNQSVPLDVIPIQQPNDFSTLKVRVFNPSCVYFKSNNGMFVLKFGTNGKFQKFNVNKLIIQDFSVTSVSVNGCLAYFSQGSCTIQTFEGNKIIYKWLNSLIDFHIGRNILALQCQQQKQIQTNQQSGRVIAIKKSFRSIDKISANQKKAFIQSLFPFDSIQSIGNTKLILVRTGKQNYLYKDGDSITKLNNNDPTLPINIPNFQQVFEIKTNDQTSFAILSQGKIIQYNLVDLKICWEVQNIVGTLFSCNFELLAIMHRGLITVIDFEKRITTKFNLELPGDILKFYIVKNCTSFVKRNSGEYHPTQKQYLLYAVTKNTFDIYLLKPKNAVIIHIWSTNKVASGLAFLYNSLSKVNKNPNDLDQFKSISDPHYTVTNLVLPQVQKESKYCIITFKYIELPSQTVVMIMNSNNQCFLYKKVLSDASTIGFIFKRVILSIHNFKPESNPFVSYTSEIIRFGSRILYDDVLMDIAEPFKHCFLLGGELWLIGNDNRMRLVDIKGNRIQGKLVHNVTESGSYHGIESSPQWYIFFTRQTVELYDKDLVSKNKIAIKNSKTPNTSSQEILLAKVFQSHCAISSYEYFKSASGDFQSYKFLFSVYDLKDKSRTQPLIYEQPIVSIKFSRPGRVVFASSSVIIIAEIKSNRLQILKTISYSMRGYLSNMAYWKLSNSSMHFMAFGGSMGGLSLFGLDQEKLFFQQKWFEPLPFGIRDIELFVYGTSIKAIIADNDKNVIIMDVKDQKTTKISDFYLGTLVNKLTKVQDPNKGQIVYCCCADGSIRVFTAIKRIQGNISLKKLQTLIHQQLPTLGGLTLQYRKLKQQLRSYKIGSKGNIVQIGTFQLLQSISHELRTSIIEKSQYEQKQIDSIITNNCIF